MNHSKMIAAKRIAVAVAAVCATLSAPAFAANDTKNLLDLMLKKGVITQAEYDEYMKSDAYENSQFKDQRIDQDVSKSVKFMQKRDKDGAVKGSGFGLVSEDGKNEINLTGRLHLDARFFNSPFTEGGTNAYDTGGAKSGDQFDVRRARIGVNGKFAGDFNYEMVWNAAASDSSNIDTGWVNYSAVKEAQFRVGRFKQPFNLEDYGTSSNNIDFIERSYVNQVAPGKKIGFMLHGVPMDGVVYGVSTFQETNSVTTGSGNRQYGARVAANAAKLANMNDQILHFGLAATSGGYDVAQSGTATIASLRSEHRGVEAYKSTFAASGASDISSRIDKNLIGAELVYGYGPFKFQSEYSEAKFTAKDVPAGTTDATGKIKIYYLAAVYNLTGEKWSDSYKDGGFGSIKPNSNFSATGNGKGAWQVGIRYSTYDASDLTGTETGSQKGNTATIGLTWFVNPNARVMLNHSVTRFDTALTSGFTGTVAGDSERVTTIRTQYNF